MGLKSMHAEKQSEQLQQSVQNNSLIEQQSQRIAELETQIQKLSSDKQELVSTIAEQGRRIAEQSEQIEKLNEADNVLKLNEELKKQNEKLKQEKQNAEQEAEAEVLSVKEDYAEKSRHLDSLQSSARESMNQAEALQADLSHQIQTKAEALVESKRKALQGEYEAKQRSLDSEYKALTVSHKGFLFGCLLYGVLTTVFTAIRSEQFVSDFKAFFIAIWQFLVDAFQLLLKGGQWASQLGDKIPQPVVATIVHYLLFIVFVGGIGIGVAVLIFLGARKLFEFYTDDYADTISLAVFLVSLAIAVYFAELIRTFSQVNLILSIILVHILYVLGRMYVRACKRSRGYY